MNTPDPRNNDRNELDTKVKLSRRLPNVKGNVWWHGYWVTGNYKGVADSLAMKYQSTIALPPEYGDKSLKPSRVKDLQVENRGDRLFLTWTGKRKYHDHTPEETDAVRYVVYEFFAGEEIDLDDPQAIIAVTPYNSVLISDDLSQLSGSTFVVTALDRMNRESDPEKIKVK